MSFGKRFKEGFDIFCDEKINNPKPFGIMPKTERRLRNAERKNNFIDAINDKKKKWGF